MFLEGKNIYLRPLEERDLTDRYVSWLNDSKVCAYNSHAIFPYTLTQLKDYFQYVTGNKNAVILAIVDKKTNLHIGNISLQSINWINRNAEFAILIGDTDFWGKGISTEASHLMYDYGFKRLNLHRIYYGTFAESTNVHKMAARLKMKQEGIRRQDVFKDGAYHDIVEYGVLYDEFYA